MSNIIDTTRGMQPAVNRLVQELPKHAVERFAQLLAEEMIGPFTNSQRVLDFLLPTRVPLEVVAHFLDCWKANTSATAPLLAVMMSSALSVKDELARMQPDVRLVWTGPYMPKTTGIRSTLPTILEMLDGARERILIVGYSVNPDADAARSVLDSLVSARLRGCEITFALHRDQLNHQGVRAYWPSNVPLPRMLYWTAPLHDHMASLHAKMLIVDSKELLITSANLSHHGLEANIETGVLVRGGPAMQLAKHFASLESSFILQEYEFGI